MDSASARATEALEYATVLERATETLIANAVLSHAAGTRGNRKGAASYAQEVERLFQTGAAAWTREIVEKLDDKRSRAARKGG